MGLQVDLLAKGKTCHAKEFIDFEFNGKHVSDFGLVVVSDGDRLSFDASPEFEDETSEVAGADGQLYWGTRFKTKQHQYKLATDGMTEQQLNDFKAHFKPGTYGKLIDCAQPYRYCYCRLDATTNFTFVPFRKKVKVMDYDIEVNEYKGEATLSFVQDDPHIYSTANYLSDTITKANAQTVLRGMYDNNIPHASSWAATIDDKYSSILGIMKVGSNIIGSSTSAIRALCFLGSDKVLSYNGTTSSLVNWTWYSPETFTDPLIYYNPSVSACRANITLKFAPALTAVSVSDFQPIYFANIIDDINATAANAHEPYNRVESSERFVMKNNIITIPTKPNFIATMKYTTPNVIHSIHRAIEIAWKFKQSGNNNYKDLEIFLQEEIIHPRVIAWAMLGLSYIKARSEYNNNGVIKYGTVAIPQKLLNGSSSTFAANWFAYFNVFMLMYFATSSGSLKLEDNKYTAFSTFYLYLSGQYNNSNISYTTMERAGKSLVVEENCGDVMLSDYIELSGGDTINSDGKVASCHCLQFTCGGNFVNFPAVSLDYKYVYM